MQSKDVRQLNNLVELKLSQGFKTGEIKLSEAALKAFRDKFKTNIFRGFKLVC